MATRIQLRRDTAANWTSNNPTLANGEMGVETDTFKFKIGNGSTAWNALQYASSTSSYADSDVDVHLNTSTAASGEYLSWNGTDYSWDSVSAGATQQVATDGDTYAITDNNRLFVTASATVTDTGYIAFGESSISNWNSGAWNLHGSGLGKILFNSQNITNKIICNGPWIGLVASNEMYLGTRYSSIYTDNTYEITMSAGAVSGGTLGAVNLAIDNVDKVRVKQDDTTISNSLKLTNIPTSDPSTNNEIWNDNGVLVFSGSSAFSEVPNPIELKQEFAGASGQSLPHFTSATNGDWNLSSITSFGSPTYDVWKAFDSDDTSTLFHTSSASAISAGAWIQIDNSAQKFTIDSFRTKNRTSGAQGVGTEFEVYGTNDGGSTLTLIETVTPTVAYSADGTYVVFGNGVDNTTAYKGYRFVVTGLAKGGSTVADSYWEATDFEVTYTPLVVTAVSEIEATGNTTNSTLTFKQYEGGVLTSYPIYKDESVDAHLNSNTAANGQFLSWDGTDYAWDSVALEKQYSYQGALETNVSTFRLYLPNDVTSTSIAAYLGTASSSGTVDLSFKINGSTDTTFSIAESATSATATSSTAISAGGYVTIDITGAGTGASDLYVLLSFAG